MSGERRIKFRQVPFLIFLLIISMNVQSSEGIATTTLYTTDGSGYYLDASFSNTTWTQGLDYTITVKLHVQSFGSSINDFHDIVLYIAYVNVSTIVIWDQSTGLGNIGSVGGEYEFTFTVSPTSAFPSTTAVYVGSTFREDKTLATDPSTDDGWNFITTVSVVEAEINIPIIEYWSPAVYQQLNEDDDDGTPGTYVYHEDYITSINYDGDWIGDNNWNNFLSFRNDLYATVYSWQVETSTQYFLGYAFYHPRDWEDGNIDSEHENDMEGILVVVQKDANNKYGDFLYMQTIAHSSLYDYTDLQNAPSSLITSKSGHSIDGDVSFDLYNGGSHPRVFLEAKGHGAYGDENLEYTSFDYDKPYIRYISGDTAGLPSLTGDDNSNIEEDVTYTLTNFNEVWGKREAANLFYSFGKFLGNDDDSANAADDCGNGLTVICQENSASAPWGWDQGSDYSGQIWYEPAELGNNHFTFSDTFDSPTTCASSLYTNRTVTNMCLLSADTIIPDVSGSSTYQYTVGDTGNSLSFTLGDTHPGIYNTTMDGVLYNSTQSWTNGSVSIAIDNLGVGSHTLIIYVYDSENNTQSKSVSINVLQLPDTTLPDVSGPSTYQYTLGETENTLSLTVGDKNPGVYNTTMDGALYNSTQSWSNGSVSIAIDNLGVGSHTLIIYVYDLEGNKQSHTVNIEVLSLPVSDTTVPDVSGSSTYQYTVGERGNSLSFTLGDKNPGVYNTTMDAGLYNSTKTWTNGTISINVDGLGVGLHSLIIYVYDLEGNQQSHTVSIEVLSPPVSDTTLPDVSGPSTYQYVVGDLGNSLSFTLGDKNPGVYNTTMDGGLYESAISWTNGSISVSIDGLNTGIYTLTLYVFDLGGNFRSHTVNIEVLPLFDTTPPDVSGPDNYQYTVGELENILVLDVGDLNPNVYDVILDGVLYLSDVGWINGSINIQVDGLEVGTYTFEVAVYDMEGNSFTHVIIVTVEDIEATNPPTSSTRSLQSSIIDTSTISKNSESTDGSTDQSSTSSDSVFLLYPILISLIALIHIVRTRIK